MSELNKHIDIEFINNTPDLIFLLSILDLLPEQLEVGTNDEYKLYVLIEWFKHVGISK